MQWIVLRASLALVIAIAHAAPTRALTWESIGPDGGRLDGIVQCVSQPQRWYGLLYREGVVRSDDHGSTWARIVSSLPMDSQYDAIGRSRVDADIILIAPPSGGEILRSTDAGHTWTPAFVVSGLTRVVSIEFAPWDPDLVLLASWAGPARGIHRSTDAGFTWEFSSSGLLTPDTRDVEFHPTESMVVLTGTSDGVYRSTDGGVSWVLSQTSGSGKVEAISFAASDPQRVWASRSSTAPLLSQDGGLSFNPPPASPQCDFPGGCGINHVAASRVDADVLVTGMVKAWTDGENIFEYPYTLRSLDAANTWSHKFEPSQSSDGRVTREMLFDLALGDRVVLALTGVGTSCPARSLYVSTDRGGSWEPSQSGMRGVRIARFARDVSGRFYARGDLAQGLWCADELGGAWTMRSAPTFHLQDFVVDRRAFGVLYESGHVTSGIDLILAVCFRSSDGGSTWQSFFLPQSGFVSSAYRVTPGDLLGQTIYVWMDSEDFDLARSFDGGESFEEVQTGISVTEARAFPGDHLDIFVLERGPSGGARITTDGGDSWQHRESGLPVDSAVRLFLHQTTSPNQGDEFFVLTAVYRTAGAYRSTDEGLSWSAIPLPGLGSAVVVDADWDPETDRLFLATEDDGVYVSGLGFVNDGLMTRDLTSIAYDATTNSLALGTDHSSVWLLPLTDVTASPSVPASAQPTQLALRAAPNPFAASVRLELALPSDFRRMELSIFDVAGRRISTLASGPREAGEHAVTWDGTTTSGRRVPPGVYFARLTADGSAATQRVVLLGE